MGVASTASPLSGGRRRSGASVKTLKRVLKKAGLKVSGKKATLTRRAKKAHLKMGGAVAPPPMKEEEEGSEGADLGGRRRRRSYRRL
jgi:hypothetical protein